MKKIINIFIVITIILIQLTSCSKNIVNEQKDDIFIYYTSDVHCAISENIGYSSLSAFIKNEKKNHPYVTLVDLGDFLQDNAKNSNDDNSISSLSKGKAIVEIMNAVGYDIVTVGNHEFDFGLDNMKKDLSLLSSDVIACNIKYLGEINDYPYIINDYVIKNYDDTKVAFIGVTTPEILTKVSKEIVKDKQGNDLFYLYENDNGNELYKRVQKIVNSVRKRVDYIVIMSHLGDNTSGGYSSFDLINNTYDIDAVLDSHSHNEIESMIIKNMLNKDVILSNVGKSLNNIGKLILTKNHEIKTSLIHGHDNNGNPIVMEDDKCVLDIINKINNDVYSK